VLWLVGQLPETSAYWASVRGGGNTVDHRPWTTDVVLLAAVVNLLAGANWQRGGGKGRRPQPVPLPRPRSSTGGGGRAAAAARIRAGVAAARRAPPHHQQHHVDGRSER
jgi:hypothetical protein